MNDEQMNDERLKQLIDRAFAEELQAMRDEFSCVRHNDHAGAADASKARLRALDRAGVLIGKLSHMRGTK